MIKVLFVCMGNICRSPTAQGVFKQLLREEALLDSITVDSAGTYAYHIGEQPDERAQAAAMKRGVNLGDQQARCINDNDFTEFDYLLAMDRDNYNDLLSLCPVDMKDKLHLLLDFAPELGIREVPDPYYGGVTGFERVLDLIELAARGLLADIRRQHGI